jgi:hypothetical protein
MTLLRRDLLPMEVLDPWVTRLVEAATPKVGASGDPHAVTGNIETYLRALHLRLALAPDPPRCRADLLLSLIDGLRRTNPGLAS